MIVTEDSPTTDARALNIGHLSIARECLRSWEENHVRNDVAAGRDLADALGHALATAERQQQQIDRLTRAVQLLATPGADRTEVAKILEGE